MNLRYFLSVIISTCCNFLFGYHLVALNNYSFITNFEIASVGIATSMFSAGGLIGSILSGLKLRRKLFLLLCGSLCTIGSIIQLSEVIELICLGRVVVGILNLSRSGMWHWIKHQSTVYI
eukprot:NODE_629_length_5211_cov_0.605243.p4 type:complete len:120 gc:universal NODE_629_length_5211_cov_0.605243:3072-2713(-)